MAQAIMGAQILKPPIAAPIQAQLTSRLLRLPGELRNLIYAFVFSSTCIHYGPQKAKLIPRITKHPLSLLLTCRQTYHETKDIWLPRVEFSFVHPIPMVTRLRTFPAEAPAQIRHIRMYSSRRSYSDWITTFEDMLEANLPDVRPKTLTVVGMSSWRACTLTLGQLIRDGTVWGEKELKDMGRFVGPATRKNYCFEVSWTPRRLLVSPGEKKKENLKVSKVVDATAWRDYEAMKVSLTVYRDGRRLAVFGSGREQMRSIKWLEEERTYEKLRKKGSWKRFWKRISSGIWNRVKQHRVRICYACKLGVFPLCFELNFYASPCNRTAPEPYHQSSKPANEDLFRYTSGRWIYNEHLRLAERYLKINILALLDTIANACNRHTTDITSFTKLSEGGFNRIFQTTFNDGKRVLAKLPYPSTMPKHYTVASEAATLDFLRGHGIRTPEVYAYFSRAGEDGDGNPVGAEYIIMEKLDGIPLGEVWYTMTPDEQFKVMRQVVELEARIMGFDLPAFGSIYYQRDLPTERNVPLEDAFCIGPMAHWSWWNGGRSNLNIDRGPWTSSSVLCQAVGKRELAWSKAHAKPRLHYERAYREIHGFRKSSPDQHIRNLTDYLSLTPYLGFEPGRSLNRPVLRHPDFQPNNILVSESKEVTGLVDWQHSTILSLSLAARMPHYFQNYGDEESDKLLEPQLDLPPDYNTLSESDQVSVRETQRRRLVHYLYATLTRQLNNEYTLEGDSVSLQAEIIRFTHLWPMLISAASRRASPAPPVKYPDTVVEEIFALDERQKEAYSDLKTMRDMLGVDIQGWVPNDQYEFTMENVRRVKAALADSCEGQDDVIALKEHFPFDDFDERG